uniref:Enoyl-CoA hydratase n=1 Tax=Alexandrium monilatum TaxID=311494 RepID=A0A7S4QA87_9DINO
MAASRRLGVLGRQLSQASAAAEAEPVLFDLTDGIATITLNRPDNRNSMTPDLLDAFGRCVERCKHDHNVRCVVITGRGESFCAGADFKNPPGALGGYEGYQSPWEKSRYNTYGPFLSVRELRVPVIAAMNGHAIGGGLGLALVCDIRVASEAARYGSNFVRLGLHPGMATTYILPRLVGTPRAAELIFTGRLISGAEAAQVGLANYAVPQAEVLGKAMELAREIASAAPLAVKWAKDSLTQHTAFDPLPAALLEAHMQSRTSETRDSKEGVKALLQKRQPKFEGR